MSPPPVDGDEAGQAHTNPLEYIEVLRDRRAINERFAELQAHVKKEILVFTKLPYATPPQENAEGLGVIQTHDARSLYEFSVFDDTGLTFDQAYDLLVKRSAATA